ncbi:ABC transporter substrate binding protein [Ancylomarina sp. 16SWW S1-10-2]|uniref:sensor histidine kinase n=1 Tax=Ancylomarina sp. 16SWW S1-10-2 TaxID=2499681 RepID=UPI00189E0D9E|nr:ABC transporter substrate binding protein [Ancylomarina sp. 16SWW S1-10-2]
MKFKYHFLLIFCLFILVNPLKARKKKVLVLHSYHQGLNWTDNITRGIQSVFNQYDNLELQFEYMDSKRNSDSIYLKEFAKLYELRHHDIPFEVIIASDNNALEFVRKYQDIYFKDIPVVFASIDQFDESLIAGMDNVTGVTEFIDFKRTIQEALRLHPKAKNLVVINDNQTTSAIINRNYIKSFWPEIDTDINLVFLENLSIKELVSQVKSLDESNIILLLNFSKDQDGNYISYQENIEIISEATKLPIYSSWVFYLGEGIVGGMLTSGFDQGKLSAQIALRVINGENINQIPYVTSGYNSLIFDYNQMKRFGIKPNELPKGSRIINLPMTFFEKNKSYLLLTFVFLLLIVLIVLYTRHIRKRNENRLFAINKDLELNKTRLLRMLDSNSDGVWEHNFKTECFTCSKQIWLNLGYDLDLIKNTIEFVYAHIHPDDKIIVKERRLDYLKGKTKTFEVVFRFCNAEHEWMWYKGKGKILDRDEDNAPINMVGTLIDITQRKLAEEQVHEDKKQIIASEKRWRSLVEQAADEILIHDFTGEIIDANSSACKIFGYNHKDLLQMNVASFDCKYTRLNLEAYWNMLSPQNSSLSIESIQKRADGSTFPVEMNLSLIDLEEDRLILAVVRDISKRQETERKVLNAVIKTEETERRRFAKDLHDSIGPLLSSINLYLSALNRTDEEEKKQRIVKVSREAVTEALVSIKEISNNLSPHILSDFGLEKAIDSFTHKLKVSESINITFHAENLNERLNEQIEVVIYRVVTELINNTIKHAKANNIEINLSREKIDLKLIYIDDGIGFDIRKTESDKSTGMGLHNILSRVRSLNGTYKMKSKFENGGMMTIISVPLESKENL